MESKLEITLWHTIAEVCTAAGVAGLARIEMSQRALQLTQSPPIDNMTYTENDTFMIYFKSDDLQLALIESL